MTESNDPKQIQCELGNLYLQNTRGRKNPDAIFLRNDLWEIIYQRYLTEGMILTRPNTSWNHFLMYNILIIPDDCVERMYVCMDMSIYGT